MLEINNYDNPKNINDEDNLHGYIYELYCYNYLIENYKEINFIKSHIDRHIGYNNFRYSKYGNIEYWSNNTILSEFDAIGIENDKVILFEITRNTNSNSGLLKRRLYKKEYLLKNIFKNYIIEINIVSPKFNYEFNKYNFTLIPEPNYDIYKEKGTFHMNKRINKCIHLKYLNSIPNSYDYINDLIEKSFKYFNNELEIAKIKKLYLFSKFYKIENENTIKYYDINKNLYGKYVINQDKIFNENDEIVLDNEIYEMLKRIG
jgi:hypothetical protein